MAQRKLSLSGMIILNNFSSQGQPLWIDQVLLLRPWSAVARFGSENAYNQVVPLGELPWLTKLGSQVTSLAVLSRLKDS